MHVLNYQFRGYDTPQKLQVRSKDAAHDPVRVSAIAARLAF